MKSLVSMKIAALRELGNRPLVQPAKNDRPKDDNFPWWAWPLALVAIGLLLRWASA